MSRWSRLATLTGITGKAVSRRAAVAVKHALQSRKQRREAVVNWQTETAEDVAEALSHLKGAAMKVGQQMAIAAASLDLPAEVRSTLSRLNNDAEPVPFDDIRATLEEALEGPLDKYFSWVEPTPLGTASLGQAHAARLRDGRSVVVKVLHPGVAEGLESDLLAFRAILLSGRAFGRDRRELDDIYVEVEAHLRAELDYLQEAANIEAYADVFAGTPGVHVARTVPSLCTENVLTMDRLPGVSLDSFLTSASPAARQRAGLTLSRLFFEGAFHHRLLHADPHDGNFLFLPDGDVAVLDLGCVKRFDPFWLGTYAQAVLGALDGDRDALLEACTELGVWSGDNPAAGAAIWHFCDAALRPWREGESVIGQEEDLVVRCRPATKELWRYPEVRGARDMVYLHRTLAGLYSMARRLEVRDAWGERLRGHMNHAIAVARGEVHT